MASGLDVQIGALSDQDALIAGRSLLVLLDLKLKGETGADRPTDVNPADFAGLIEASGPAGGALKSAIAKAGDAEAAAAARGC